MVDLECPSRRTWTLVLFLLSGFASATATEPVMLSPRWQMTFPLSANGKEFESTAVPVDGESRMVVVVPAGADLIRLKLQVGNRSVPFKVIGHDPVSRLGFIQIAGSDLPRTLEWAEDSSASSSSDLKSLEPSGPVKCRTTGWVKQVGGKILPLALLRVSFSRAVPPPGTPLLDETGRIVAIVFQSSGSGNTGYAIPAEAVRRVQRDVCKGGGVVRGWLGLALRTESQMPQISRVLPDSPAEAAGLQPNDVLVSIGARPVTDYADAVNAFFYLIPGQPVKVKVLRDAEPLEITLTPVTPKGP